MSEGLTKINTAAQFAAKEKAAANSEYPMRRQVVCQWAATLWQQGETFLYNDEWVID